MISLLTLKRKQEDELDASTFYSAPSQWTQTAVPNVLLKKEFLGEGSCC